MNGLKVGLVLAVCVTLMHVINASKYSLCLVCKAVVLEAEDIIRNVDPKQTIQTGSFRVDSNGNQNIQDKQYARSNTHIEEVVESICVEMFNYGDRVYDNGSRQLVRIKGESDEHNDEIELDDSKGRALKIQCHNFVDDYEEDLIAYLQEEISDHERYICFEKTGACTEKQLEEKLETVPKPKRKVEIDDEDDDDGDDDADEEQEDEDEKEDDNDNKDASEKDEVDDETHDEL